MNTKSRSALTFSELKNKTEEIYEFGNDWGLYIDIEMNYQNHFREKKINKVINTLDKIIENENEFENENERCSIYKEINKNKNNKFNIYNYFNTFTSNIRQLIIYLFIAFEISYIIDDKNL